jgi:hypothetical protein
LRELAYEEAVATSHGLVRIGLAATPWQLQQSLSLLARLEIPNPLSQPGEPGNTDASLDRVVALALNTSLNSPSCGALASIWLRRDGDGGLPQDRRGAHHRALQNLRETGCHLVAIEALVFDERAPAQQALVPMMSALKRIAVELWNASDIVATCPRTQLAHYCGELGFARFPASAQENPRAETVLLRLPLQPLTQVLDSQRTDKGAEALRA